MEYYLSLFDKPAIETFKMSLDGKLEDYKDTDPKQLWNEMFEKEDNEKFEYWVNKKEFEGTEVTVREEVSTPISLDDIHVKEDKNIRKRLFVIRVRKMNINFDFRFNRIIDDLETEDQMDLEEFKFDDPYNIKIDSAGDMLLLNTMYYASMVSDGYNGDLTIRNIEDVKYVIAEIEDVYSYRGLVL